MRLSHPGHASRTARERFKAAIPEDGAGAERNRRPARPRQKSAQNGDFAGLGLPNSAGKGETAAGGPDGPGGARIFVN